MKMEILSIYTWPVHASYVCVCARAHSNIIVILIAVLVSLSVSLPSRHQFNRLLTACIVSLLDFKSLNVLLKYCVKWNSMILLIRSHFSFIDLVFKTPQAFIWVLRRTILWLLYFLLSILTIWSWVKMLNTYANWQSENKLFLTYGHCHMISSRVYRKVPYRLHTYIYLDRSHSLPDGTLQKPLPWW